MIALTLAWLALLGFAARWWYVRGIAEGRLRERTSGHHAVRLTIVGDETREDGL